MKQKPSFEPMPHWAGALVSFLMILVFSPLFIDFMKTYREDPALIHVGSLVFLGIGIVVTFVLGVFNVVSMIISKKEQPKCQARELLQNLHLGSQNLDTLRNVFKTVEDLLIRATRNMTEKSDIIIHSDGYNTLFFDPTGQTLYMMSAEYERDRRYLHVDKDAVAKLDIISRMRAYELLTESVRRGKLQEILGDETKLILQAAEALS